MSTTIKFQAPFERLKSYEVSPDISLQKGIITQAIIDATNTSNLREAKKLEMEAKAWIFGGSEYFQELCIEAGIEPSFVIKLAKQIIKLHKSQTKPSKNQQYHRKSKDHSDKSNDISKKLEIII